MARPCERTHAAGLLNGMALPGEHSIPTATGSAWRSPDPQIRHRQRDKAPAGLEPSRDGYSSEKLPIRSSSLADVAEPGALTRGSAARSMQ